MNVYYTGSKLSFTNDTLFAMVKLCFDTKWKYFLFKLIMDDVVIIGGGIIGTASAYFLSKRRQKGKVIEQDPTYKSFFSTFIRRFSKTIFSKENILLGKFAREFIFQVPELLKTKKNPNPTTSVVPNGYLFLFGPDHALNNMKHLKIISNVKLELKTLKDQTQKKFPYVNDEGIETVTYTDDKKKAGLISFIS